MAVFVCLVFLPISASVGELLLWKLSSSAFSCSDDFPFTLSSRGNWLGTAFFTGPSLGAGVTSAFTSTGGGGTPSRETHRGSLLAITKGNRLFTDYWLWLSTIRVLSLHLFWKFWEFKPTSEPKPACLNPTGMNGSRDVLSSFLFDTDHTTYLWD